LELIKDYDLEIHYHPGNANVVADALSRKAQCSCMSVVPLNETLYYELERLNLGIITHDSLANLVLSPTLRDRIISAQEHDVGMEKIRQRLVEKDPRTKCFVYMKLEFYGLRIVWWYLKIWSSENKFLMKPISLDILSTQAAIKCIKI